MSKTSFKAFSGSIWKNMKPMRRQGVLRTNETSRLNPQSDERAPRILHTVKIAEIKRVEI
jgi:hypothetical protein